MSTQIAHLYTIDSHYIGDVLIDIHTEIANDGKMLIRIGVPQTEEAEE